MYQFIYDMMRTQKMYDMMMFNSRSHDRTHYTHRSKTFKKNRRKQLKKNRRK